MTHQEIVREIVSGQFTNLELEQIIDAVRFARKDLMSQAVRNFVVGDAVKFTNPRNGRVFTGQVEKVNRKYIHVRTSGTVYRVPGNLLEGA